MFHLVTKGSSISFLCAQVFSSINCKEKPYFESALVARKVRSKLEKKTNKQTNKQKKQSGTRQKHAVVTKLSRTSFFIGFKTHLLLFPGEGTLFGSFIYSPITQFATLETRRELVPKCAPQLFLGSQQGTSWSAIGQFVSRFSLVPRAFP